MEHSEHREEFDLTDHPHAYDTSDPKGSAIAIFGGVTIVVLIAVVLGIQFYFDRAKEQQIYMEVLAPEGEALKNLRAKEDTALHSYGYIDRQKGMVRIPIERAMELLAKESAENRLRYSTTPARVKTPEELAGLAAVAQGGTGNVSPAIPAP